MSETIGGVVIHQSGRLHMGVHHGTPYKSKPPLFEIFGQGLALRSGGRDLRHHFPVINFWCSADKFPDVPIEGPERFLQLKKSPGIRNCGLDFETIPDNPRIVKQRRFFSVVKLCNFHRIKSGKGAAIAFTAKKDSRPGQTRLCPFQDQHFKVAAIIMNRNAPFFIMIGNKVGFRSHPSTADGFVGLAVCVTGHVQSDDVPRNDVFVILPPHR